MPTLRVVAGRATLAACVAMAALAAAGAPRANGAAPPCPARALSVEVGPPLGATGHNFRGVSFVNRSRGMCSLTGYPHATAISGGLALTDAGWATWLYNPSRLGSLGPGEAATVGVENAPNLCPRGFGPDAVRTRSDAVAFHLAGGDLVVPLSLDVTCGFTVTRFGV